MKFRFYWIFVFLLVVPCTMGMGLSSILHNIKKVLKPNQENTENEQKHEFNPLVNKLIKYLELII